MAAPRRPILLLAVSLLGSAGALRVPLTGPLPRAAAVQPHRALAPQALLDRAALLLAEAGEQTAALSTADILGPAAGVAVLGVLGYLAATNQLWNPTTGAILPLLFLSGDSEKLAESGATTVQNEALKKFALSVTPSAWKKAYQGVDDDGVRLDPVTGEAVAAALLELPLWMGDEARALVEPEAVACVQALQMASIEVPSVGAVETCFLSLRPTTPADAPPVVLIHGFDSSILEFRYIYPALLNAGLRVEAMEWWTGGFTAREPFTRAITDSGAKPWDLIRSHQLAFLDRQLPGQKVVLLGASLGGAVALDFAARHPERVEALILMDAGGESYAQPDPWLTSLCADPVTNLFQWRATNGLLPYPHVWAQEDGWRQALRAYLKSGGYQAVVGPPLIKTVSPPTYILWGEKDDVLPVADLYKYEADLPDCRAAVLVPDAQHAPALENPSFVAERIVDFTMKAAEARRVPSVA
jgi:pimeloyl-ACP methyl ester carboxylesterase